MLSDNRFLIVDGYGSAASFASEVRRLKGEGHCDHLNSRDKVLVAFRNTFRPHDFANLYDSVEAVLKSKLKYDFIVGGCDYSISTVDKLAEKFNISARNPTQTTAYRRNKFLMIEKLKKHHLSWVNQIKSSQITEIQKWLQDETTKYPIVVKPPESAGADNVTICSSMNNALVSATKVLSCENVYMEKNQEVLLMEHLSGEKFMVDTVSFDGHHVVVGIFRTFQKPGKNPVEHKMILEPLNSPVSKELTVYAKKVLSALELYYGPAHLEIVMTPLGPHLIELNPRFHGHLNFSAMDKALGFNQLRLTAEIYLNRRNPRTLNACSHQLYGWVLNALVHVPVSMVLTKTFPWDKVAKLESYQSMCCWKHPGSYINPTVDVKSALGYICLFHEKKAFVERDYRIIRDIEKRFFTKASG